MEPLNSTSPRPSAKSERATAVLPIYSSASSSSLSFDLLKNQNKVTLNTTWATIRAYKKINISSAICFSDGSNWIVGVGSFIYKSKTGEEALSMIISEFSASKISDLKKVIRGIYSFAIYKNEVVYFFNDYYGLFVPT